MSVKQPSFQDRTDLSDLEMEPEPDEVAPTTSTETLIPVHDTGVRTVRSMGRETRSLKRAQEKGNDEDPPIKGKKTRTCSGEDIKTLIAHQRRQGETLQEVLKELRNLSTCIDNLRTTVTNKMTTMETKLSVQQDRIESLQTARRDGFINTLTLDTTQSAPLQGTPHYIPQPASYGGSQSSITPTAPPMPSPLDSLGF